MRNRTLRALAASAVLATAVGGCGSDDKKDTTSTGTGGGGNATGLQLDPAIAAKVPADIKAKGTITVGSDPTYAPSEFLADDGKTIIGLDPDIGHALGTITGLKFDYVKAGFDAILPGLKSKKYDIGMSSFTDTKEREQEFDFVTYFVAGSSFFVKAQGGPAINTLADLCGHKVAVEKGTTQQDDSTAQAKKCASEGKPKLDLQTYPDQNGANQALVSGRADVGLADSPVADYQVKQAAGQFKLSGKPYGTAPYGIALPKGSKLAPVLQEALKKLIASPQYAAILKKWGVDSGAITEPVINGAES